MLWLLRFTITACVPSQHETQREQASAVVNFPAVEKAEGDNLLRIQKEIIEIEILKSFHRARIEPSRIRVVGDRSHVWICMCAVTGYHREGRAIVVAIIAAKSVFRACN